MSNDLVKMKYNGDKPYRGFDPVSGLRVILGAGAEFFASPKLADQLLKDHADKFEVVDGENASDDAGSDETQPKKKGKKGK